MMIDKVRELILPISVILTLTLGNYLRLTESEIQTLQDSFLAIGTGIVAIVGIYYVARKKKDDNDSDPKDPK